MSAGFNGGMISGLEASGTVAIVLARSGEALPWHQQVFPFMRLTLRMAA